MRQTRKPDGARSGGGATTADPGERLQKVLSRAGVTSRRAAEDLIRAGRVRVNGVVVDTLGCRVRPGKDAIQVDGAELRREPRAYVLLHKPRGVVSTVKDPEGRRTVLQLLPRPMPRLYPVGRLDVSSSGLMLLTNDGDVAYRLTHPRYGVSKTYHVKVAGHPEPRVLARLKRGVRLEGRRTAPVVVRVLKTSRTKSWLEFTVMEGRHHLIRGLCEAIHHRVEKLSRTRMGPLLLGSLPPGACRPLSRTEVDALRAALGLAGPARGRARPRVTPSSQRRTPGRQGQPHRRHARRSSR